MILLGIISFTPIYLGLKINYCSIDHFNNHFQFLENRASILGWNGSFGRFSNFLYSPILELRLMKIENFSANFGVSFFKDKNTGDFIYPAIPETLWLNQEWNYWRLIFNFKFHLNIKSVIFISGFQVSHTKLTIEARGNYKFNDEYPQYFESDDLGLFVGWGKKFQKFQFELYYNYTPIDQFRNEEGYLFYSEEAEYIYIGPVHHRNPSAILNHSGVGVVLIFKIFK